MESTMRTARLDLRTALAMAGFALSMSFLFALTVM
jgi:hypothetical protein